MVAQQLGGRASQSEEHLGPEGWVAGEPGDRLDAARGHGLEDGARHVGADRLAHRIERGHHCGLVLEIEADPAALGLVHELRGRPP